MERFTSRARPSHRLNGAFDYPSKPAKTVALPLPRHILSQTTSPKTPLPVDNNAESVDNGRPLWRGTAFPRKLCENCAKHAPQIWGDNYDERQNIEGCWMHLQNCAPFLHIPFAAQRPLSPTCGISTKQNAQSVRLPVFIHPFHKAYYEYESPTYVEHGPNLNESAKFRI